MHDGEKAGSPTPRPVPRLLRSPWPWTLGLLLPLFLLAQWRVWLGLQMGVLDRGVLELWVHGAQPGWLDWVPFIHPPGYSLFMNTTDALSQAASVSPASIVFVSGVALTVGAAGLAVEAARRRSGAVAALLVAALVLLDPQALRPFEQYPLARLLLLVAFLVVTAAPPRSIRATVLACLLSIELHLASWFLLGPLLAAPLLRPGPERARGGRVLGWILAGFAVSAVFGLGEVLTFGAGGRGDPGRPTVEWANPALLAAMVPGLVIPRWRPQAASVLWFAAAIWALQAAQIADGTPFPFSLHYFELVGPVAALVAAGAWASRWEQTGARWLIGAAGVLVGSQCLLFVRGLLELFVQPRWILMVG
jgi:hypothetical protein